MLSVVLWRLVKSVMGRFLLFLLMMSFVFVLANEAETLFNVVLD